MPAGAASGKGFLSAGLAATVNAVAAARIAGTISFIWIPSGEGDPPASAGRVFRQ
jgi:hypothetical protein